MSLRFLETGLMSVESLNKIKMHFISDIDDLFTSIIIIPVAVFVVALFN